MPPGFVITTDTCTDFFKGSAAMPLHLVDSWMSAIDTLEKQTGRKFGGSHDKGFPLTVSVRSGTSVDMPRSIYCCFVIISIYNKRNLLA